MWSAHHHGTPRFLLGRFPYEVVYRVWSNAVLVVAVAHCKGRRRLPPDRVVRDPEAPRRQFDSPLYPRDLRRRARVNERMDWINTGLTRELGYHLVYPRWASPDAKPTPEAVCRARPAT